MSTKPTEKIKALPIAKPFIKSEVPITATSQEHIPIADITDDLVVFKDGGACVILETSSLNFELLSDQEQEAVIVSYAALLNSLSFPIQIVIRTQVKDISNYFVYLNSIAQEITNPLLKNYMSDYTAFIADIIKKKNVLSKKFYLVIYFSPLELGVTKSFLSAAARTLPFTKSYCIQKAKISLYPKRDHVIRQAGRAGLKARQLTTAELINIFYDVYNPKVPQGQVEKRKPELKDVADGLKQGLNVLDILAPDYLEVDFSYLKVGDTYLRSLYVAGYPRFVNPGWLEPIVNFDHSLDVSFYIYPVSGKSILDDLRRKVAEMEAEIETDLERGKVEDPLTQAKLDDARSLQEELVKGAERFFEFSFYVTIPAKNLSELNQVTHQVISTLGSLLIIAQTALLDMENGLFSSLPMGQDRLMVTRNMDTTSLATTFPFTSAELSSDTGILYGINMANDSFIIFDRFSIENANATIFATSGAGKCEAYNELLLYQNKFGDVHLDEIGKVVEKSIKDGYKTKLDEESEGVINPGLKVFTFDKNLKGSWSNVKIASKKLFTKKMFRISTRSGRKTTITGDHSLIVLKNGSIETVKGKNIEIGNYIPIPRKINQNSKLSPTLNTASILKKSKINFFVEHGRIGHKQSIYKTSLPTKIVLSSQFFRTLGYFIAEGTVLPHTAVISSQNKTVLKTTKNYYDTLCLYSNFVIEDGKQVGIRADTQCFTEFLRLLGTSGKAGKKRVPPIVFNSPNNFVSNFLSAYFEGDGGVENHEITTTTKSKKLASDLSYLFLRFGIIVRIKERFKAATNSKLKKKRKYYRISISGQDNIRKFIKEIGFISKEKNEKAKKLLRSGNTNVDVIPELGSTFKEIYSELYNSEVPAPRKFSEIKLGIFKPSPKNLLSIIEKIEERMKEIENLESDGLSTLRKLPTIKEIQERGRYKEVNRFLWQKLGHSWQTMRAGTPSFLYNTLQAIEITHGYKYSTQEIGGAIYRSFKLSGESLRAYDMPLWEAVVVRDGNTLYRKAIAARDFISEKYRIKKEKLKEIKNKLSRLKTLAKSDLFWDPIVKVEKVRSKHKYVYDLQVENEVFLAGYGGMFVHNSFFVKLESLRSLMLGTEIIIIDPESEYKALCEFVGGEYISFSFSSPSKINPFDLSQIYDEKENQLGLKILSLHSLLRVIMGTITPTQDALLDRALVSTYRSKGITVDPITQKKEPPLMEDLYKILIGMEIPEALDMAARIEKFVKGSFVGIFDQHTNINLNNPFTVFTVRDMEDALRPIAMFIILDYIWTRIRRDLKKRILVVDEAWHMMRFEDSAQFLWSIVKRARKYYLGLTTITQDVEDFLNQDIGKAIVTNSAMRVLLKQSPAAIDKVTQTFYLSQGERQLLLAANVGEGILFAGPHHAPIRVVASEKEYRIMTTKPSEIMEQKKSMPVQRPELK